MARINTDKARELVRWIHLETGSNFLLRSDGQVLKRSLDGRWKIWGHVKGGVVVDQVANDIKDGGYFENRPVLIGETAPSLPTLEHWMFDGVCEATDGCRVEPDGKCEHGCESWLLVYGLV